MGLAGRTCIRGRRPRLGDFPRLRQALPNEFGEPAGYFHRRFPSLRLWELHFQREEVAGLRRRRKDSFATPVSVLVRSPRHVEQAFLVLKKRELGLQRLCSNVDEDVP